MENVSTALHCTISLVVGGDFNAVKNTLRSNDLIGAHHQQEFFRRKNAILGQDIQYRCLGKNVLVKSIRSGIIRFLASAQNDVNSKLLLVLPRFRAAEELKSLICPKRVVLE